MKKQRNPFVTKRKQNRENRDRISLRKESIRYLDEETKREKKERTRSGSRRPTRKSGYTYELIGRQTEKVYGDLGYRKGINKRPRRKLTLGNQVRRKKRKRVEETQGNQSKVIGKERKKRRRQRIRGFWDRRNLERRKTQRKYREGKQRNQRRSQKEKEEKERLVKLRKRHLSFREVEVYRNAYERRGRYQKEEERGKKRKGLWLEGKYEWTKGKREKKQTRLEKKRKSLKEQEEKELSERYERRNGERKSKFEASVKKRKARVLREEKRRRLEPVKSLRELSGKTRKERRQGKNRINLGWKGEGGKEEEDERREIPRAVPRTEYFAKRKNLRLERKGSQEREGNEEQEKWKKIPEKERTERKPNWMQREGWVDRRTKKVEDEKRKGETSGIEANYREFGKKVVYLYGVERSQRWREKEKKEEVKKFKIFKEEEKKKKEEK